MDKQNEREAGLAALDETCKEVLRRKALPENLKTAVDGALAAGFTPSEVLARVELAGAKKDSLIYLACENYVTRPGVAPPEEVSDDEQQ